MLNKFSLFNCQYKQGKSTSESILKEMLQCVTTNFNFLDAKIDTVDKLGGFREAPMTPNCGKED